MSWTVSLHMSNDDETFFEKEWSQGELNSHDMIDNKINRSMKIRTVFISYT